MALETTQLKFTLSENTGQLIGFVSRHPKTKKLIGVYEESVYKKKICVLSKDLKNKVVPKKPYHVELKPMNSGNGYVVISAIPLQFPAQVQKIVVTKSIYQVCINFGNRTVYFDPLKGGSPFSTTIDGVINVLSQKDDLKDLPVVIEAFKEEAQKLLEIMENDGYPIERYKQPTHHELSA